MKKLIVTIWDKKVGAGNLGTANTIAEAKRTLQEIVKKDEMVATYPSDYSLVALGTIDTELGEIIYEKSTIMEAEEAVALNKVQEKK